MNFYVMTLFPEMIEQGVQTSILGRAVKNGYLSLDAVNIRDYTENKHKKVDDYPYGGGAGMLMQAQPVFDCYQDVKKRIAARNHQNGGGHEKTRVVYLTPQGKTFTQKLAQEFSKEEHLIFLCGHYEGIDERVLEEIVTDYVSIGDYVLTGGELPAMVMMDAIARLVPGVLHNEVSADFETFHNDLLEYPQYSRPEQWHGKSVPEVLLSGDHKKITKWRLEQSEERTKRHRPDLYACYCSKQEWIKRLLKKDKLLYMDIIESLRRGMGEIRYASPDGILVYEPQAQVCRAAVFQSQKAAEIAADILKQATAGHLVLHQKCLLEALKQQAAVKGETCIRHAVYTQKVSLPMPKQTEFKVLDMEYLSEVSKACQAEKMASVKEQLKKGTVYGAFIDGELAGFASVGRTGSLELPIVCDKCQGMEAERALESFLLNLQLAMGYTPYVQIEAQDETALKQQEQMKLYVSKEVLYLVEKTEKSERT